MIFAPQIELHQGLADEMLGRHRFRERIFLGQRDEFQHIGNGKVVGDLNRHVLFRINDIRGPDPFQDPTVVFADRLDQDAGHLQLLQVEGDQGRQVGALTGGHHRRIHFLDPLGGQKLLVRRISQNRIGAVVLNRLHLFLVRIDGHHLVPPLIKG